MTIYPPPKKRTWCYRKIVKTSLLLANCTERTHAVAVTNRSPRPVAVRERGEGRGGERREGERGRESPSSGEASFGGSSGSWFASRLGTSVGVALLTRGMFALVARYALLTKEYDGAPIPDGRKLCRWWLILLQRRNECCALRCQCDSCPRGSEPTRHV